MRGSRSPIAPSAHRGRCTEKRSSFSWTRVFLLLGLPLACSNSSADREDGSVEHADGSAGTLTTLQLVQLSNDLIKDNYDLYCQSCACGGFLDVSSETEQCVASVIDEYPDAEVRRSIIEGLKCWTDALEQEKSCMAASSTCAEAEICRQTEDSATNDCNMMIPIGDAAAAQYAANTQYKCGGSG